jgi:hypothetical protein
MVEIWRVVLRCLCIAFANIPSLFIAIYIIYKRNFARKSQRIVMRPMTISFEIVEIIVEIMIIVVFACTIGDKENNYLPGSGVYVSYQVVALLSPVRMLGCTLSDLDTLQTFLIIKPSISKKLVPRMKLWIVAVFMASQAPMLYYIGFVPGVNAFWFSAAYLSTMIYALILSLITLVVTICVMKWVHEITKQEETIDSKLSILNKLLWTVVLLDGITLVLYFINSYFDIDPAIYGLCFASAGLHLHAVVWILNILTFSIVEPRKTTTVMTKSKETPKITISFEIKNTMFTAKHSLLKSIESNSPFQQAPPTSPT